MTPAADALVHEAKRLSESCLYTSTALFGWLKCRRRVRNSFIIAPLVLGSVAGWQLLTNSDLESVKVILSACAFIAGLLPAINAALKLDQELEACARATGEFKNLQDRFRQVALVSSHKPFEQFEAEFALLVRRLEDVRSLSLTPPERYFQRARRKIKSGDYAFDVDAEQSKDGKG